MSFVANTRQQYRQLDRTLAYSAGGRSTERLPPVGLLARMHLKFRGVMTIAENTGSVAVGEKGPYALIDSVVLKVNQGVEVIRLDGFGAHLLDITRAGKAYTPNVSNPVVNGTNDWEFDICLNITPNERDFMGLLLLQTDQMSAELEINWAQAGGTGNNNAVKITGDATAAFAGQCDVLLETFTLPADPASRPDITMVWQQIMRTDGIEHTGENRINLLRQNLYATIMHVVELNGQLADNDDIVRLKLKYNNDTTPYDFPIPQLLTLQNRRYGQNLPNGVFMHDFYYQGIPGYGTERDLINAASVVDIASIIDVASAASFGAGNNKVRTITQQFVPLA